MEIKYASKGTDTSGSQRFLVLAIPLLIGATLISQFPTLWRVCFGITGLFTYPLCLLTSLKRDDYTDGIFHTSYNSFFSKLSAFAFIGLALFLEIVFPREVNPQTFSVVSVVLFVATGYLPSFVFKRLERENVFNQLIRLNNSEAQSFLEKNESFIVKRPYLFFYEAVNRHHFILASLIHSKYKLSLSQKVLITGIGTGETETVSNLIIHKLYSSSRNNWKEYISFLQPLGLEIDSRSVELTSDPESGIKWLDKMAKENDRCRLEIRQFIKESAPEQSLNAACSDCNGSGVYFSHHNEDGSPSCPYCEGLGVIHKAS